MRIEVNGKVNRAPGRLTNCFRLFVCGERVAVAGGMRQVLRVLRILLPDCDNLQTKRGQLSGLLRRKRWQRGCRVTIITSNEFYMAPPQLFGRTASIHRQVDPERPLIGRPIEVRGFLEGGRLLQMRDLIEVYEVLKISDFFPRYGSQRPRFN